MRKLIICTKTIRFDLDKAIFASPVQVIVAVGKDAVLRHPEIQQGTKENQTGQHQMEMSPDQAASKHSGQQICCQHQGGVQDPKEEFPCCSQLRCHPVELLQADVWLENVCGLFSPQIHGRDLSWTAFLLLLSLWCSLSHCFVFQLWEWSRFSACQTCITAHGGQK